MYSGIASEIGVVPDHAPMPARRIAPSPMAPVTVAIVTFNRPHLLDQALRSCRNQILPPERVIVVDDGSSADTASIIERWKPLNIKYVNVGKVGLGNARNLATALCESKYTCLLDDDDIMLPNRISDHMTAFASGAQLTYGGWINFTPRMELEYRPGKDFDEDVMVYVGAAMTHGACCYETAVLREFPYRTDVVGEDFDFVIRAISSGIRCAHTGSYVLLRRRHGKSESSLRGGQQDTLRRAVVSMIDLTRPGADIEERKMRGRESAELTPSRCPSLSEIFGVIGGLCEPMRLVGLMPRAARDFFGLLRRLSMDWSTVDLIDEAATLTATIGLACRATADIAALESFEAELRKCSLKPALLTARGSARRLTPPMHFDAVHSFRMALRSPLLKELYLAHRIISGQRRWNWYIVARREITSRKSQPIYYLVSAPFEKRGERVVYESQVREVRRFIYNETGMDSIFVEGALGR